ncbi:hypothetical protein ACFWR9_41800 [Streptomyces sp. NPDC058534]|uniref:hypothetical protein n=1 Tax=Streptomyces sp. NPDC058534 TaxID=3346541 RepID=UPI0036532F01
MSGTTAIAISVAAFVPGALVILALDHNVRWPLTAIRTAVQRTQHHLTTRKDGVTR